MNVLPLITPASSHSFCLCLDACMCVWPSSLWTTPEDALALDHILICQPLRILKITLRWLGYCSFGNIKGFSNSVAYWSSKLHTQTTWHSGSSHACSGGLSLTRRICSHPGLERLFLKEFIVDSFFYALS